MDNHVAAWLEVQKSELVVLAEELVLATRLHEPLEQGRQSEANRDNRRAPQAAVSTNQIRNLLAAAQNGSPFAVLVNFLRYQRGRGRGAWEQESSFRKLETLFTEALPARCKEITAALPVEQKLDAEARLAAQLLGFISREYTYRRHVYEQEWKAQHGGNP